MFTAGWWIKNRQVSGNTIMEAWQWMLLLLTFLDSVTELIIRMVCWVGHMYLFCLINSAKGSRLRNILTFWFCLLLVSWCWNAIVRYECGLCFAVRACKKMFFFSLHCLFCINRREVTLDTRVWACGLLCAYFRSCGLHVSRYSIELC